MPTVEALRIELVLEFLFHVYHWSAHDTATFPSGRILVLKRSSYFVRGKAQLHIGAFRVSVLASTLMSITVICLTLQCTVMVLLWLPHRCCFTASLLSPNLA